MPPKDDSQEFTLAEVIRTGIAAAFSDVYTALPGQVVRAPGRELDIDVRLLTKASYTDENGKSASQERPILRDVPLVYPGSGVGDKTYRLTFPVRPGDMVLCIFSSEALDGWKQHGNAYVPSSVRRQHLADAIAIPGLIPPWVAAGADTPVATDAITLHSSGDVKLGGDDADERVIRERDLRNCIINIFTDPTILAKLKVYLSAVPPADGPALTALIAAVVSHFTSNVYGSDKVYSD